MNQFQYKLTDKGHQIDIRLCLDFLLTYHGMMVIKNRKGYKVVKNGDINDIYKFDSSTGRLIGTNFRVSIRSPYVSGINDELNMFVLMIGQKKMYKSTYHLFRRTLPLSTPNDYIEDLKSTLIAMSKHKDEYMKSQIRDLF